MTNSNEIKMINGIPHKPEKVEFPGGHIGTKWIPIEDPKPFDVTVGGGTSQTQISEDAGGFTFRGGWGNIMIPWDLVVWGVKGIIGLFRKK